MGGLIEFVANYGWILISIPLLLLVIGLTGGEARKSIGPFKFKDYDDGQVPEKSISYQSSERTTSRKLLNSRLKSLWKKITEFEEEIEKTAKENFERRTELNDQITELRELNERLVEDTKIKTKGLKRDVKSQDELILEKILRKSGLEKDKEYFIHRILGSDTGKSLEADVLIKLPDNKNLIVDTKVSLVDFERYIETKKDKHLNDHIFSIKKHVERLVEKNYRQFFKNDSLDYVLMFVPIEKAFAELVQHGGELYNNAHKNNIIIVSPSTLVATLRTISNIWKHEYQSRKAKEIAKDGEKIYSGIKELIEQTNKELGNTPIIIKSESDS